MPALEAIVSLSLAFSPTPAVRSLPDYLPFGVMQQERPSSLGCRAVGGSVMDTTGQYVCTSLPSGSSLFDEYIVAYVQQAGICNVVGVSPYGKDDARGSSARSLFARAKAEMTEKFGPPDEEVDHSHTPAAAKDGDFRSSVIAQDRQVFSQWNDLGARFANMQSATLVISGDEELGLAIYEVVRFAGNDDCLQSLETVTGPAPEN
ncbi:hypothetical protein ASE04_05160 [Rhizobium sp. Root708]|uniref:hypothetical protein n=1 Tax=Rhizobium sp. Root708 TaxID=1736592 RepID=UPI0006FF5116|nr:hypothetical protein [Rhizobium sp. Root708]KRB55106.1 hypothetical protein ASE04_05160 [Rhizobium sp. Root708]